MSLDFYLEGAEETVSCRCPDCGNEHPVKHRECFFDLNITHNLGCMAAAAGIYKALWRPEHVLATEQQMMDIVRAVEAHDYHGEQGVYALEAALPSPRASVIAELLREGLAKLKADPAKFKAYNATNGWGLYEHFVPFVEEVLAACERYPDAFARASR